MAKLYKFGANQLNLTSQEVDSFGQVVNIGKWNNEPALTQTLPNPMSPALLCFNPQTNNFYWAQVVATDLQPGSNVLDFYGFGEHGVETPE